MNRYAYAELRAAALAADATQEDVNALGEWFSRYGERYWKGDYFDADEECLYPIYAVMPEFPDQLEITGYTFDRDEWESSLDRCFAAGYGA